MQRQQTNTLPRRCPLPVGLDHCHQLLPAQPRLLKLLPRRSLSVSGKRLHLLVRQGQRSRSPLHTERPMHRPPTSMQLRKQLEPRRLQRKQLVSRLLMRRQLASRRLRKQLVSRLLRRKQLV